MGKKISWGDVCKLPNLITLARLLIFLPAVIYLIRIEYFSSALLLFVGGALTDVADGKIARSRNQITLLGRGLDPAADKALFITSAVLLGAWRRFGWGWISLLTLEAALFGIGFYAFLAESFGWKLKGIVLEANEFGKMKGLAELIFITTLFTNRIEDPSYDLEIAFASLSLSIILAGMSILGHLNYYLKLRL